MSKYEYDTNTEINLCLTLAMLVGAFAMYVLKDVQATKTYKTFGGISITNEIFKVGFETGHKACLYKVIDAYIECNEDPEEFANFLHNETDRVVGEERMN